MARCGHAASSSTRRSSPESGDRDEPAPPQFLHGGAPRPRRTSARRRRPRRVPEPGRPRTGRPRRRGGRRGPPGPRLRRGAGGCPRAPSSSRTQAGSPDISTAGSTRAPAGARPSTTRKGCRSGIGSVRTVSSGSSARTVPAPTRTASEAARSSCASARASGPVIHRLEPSGAAMRPSMVAASFSTTQGRPVRRCFR